MQPFHIITPNCISRMYNFHTQGTDAVPKDCSDHLSFTDQTLLILNVIFIFILLMHFSIAVPKE